MQPARRAGEETAAGELRRTYADHLDAAATHLEKVGGPMRRPWERITAATSRTFSTHHSGAGGENSRRQTAMQPGKEVGPDGTDDSNGERLGTIAHNLKTVIKPAVPTKHTQNKIEENAKNWARTTMVILRQHYTQSVEEELKALSECSKQDWEGPFEIATSWAKRNLGRRLQPDSLEQARAEIVAKLGDLGTATSTEEGPPAPRTTSKTTTATMTDHVAGDWSPSSEMEQEQERDLTPSSPPESSQPAEPNLATPKEQRVLRFAASIPETPSQERPCSPSTQPPQSGEMMDTEGLDLTQGEVTPKKTKRVNTLTVAKPQPVSHPGPSRSGLDRLTSCVQTRLQLQAAEEESSSSSSLPPSPASPGQQVRTPTRHPNTHRKLRDWHLHVKEPWLVVGDSNVSRLPPLQLTVEKDTLMYLNTFITGLKDHIPALTSDIFTTEEDDIHWSYGTSEAMLQHWEMYVNGESP
ncbi:proteoglycan 4-like [Oreochromis niloticus]|uniref:proteoglycan 4-like n=1 Tax=Oreochromis niloticus TaxID=8128 RepID=UPI0009059335|nr:proteoglycan 4-like [Oreochromis niloticus]